MKGGNEMEITINLPEDETRRLFEILEKKQSGQTAEELARELLIDAVWMESLKQGI